MRFLFPTLVLLFCTLPGSAQDSLAAKDIAAVARQGRGTPEGRAAWERVSAGGAELLPQLLAAMDTPDVVAANWLRTAYDRVLARTLASGKGLDGQALLDFAKDPKRQGRARRLALETVERLSPGITAKLLPGWLEDPEFRFDAVAALLEESAALLKKGRQEEAVRCYRRAFDASRDVQQARSAAAALLKVGVKASVAEHLGFLSDWYVIGPFDGKGQKGYHLSYAPEKKVDLAAELDGQRGKVRWKRYAVAEVPPAVSSRHVVLVDLRLPEALGDADDAVAYAWTAFAVPEAREAEFRGSADDNFTVWVNGERAFGFEEWRNGVRHDRHRFRVRLRQGVNTVLVKVCQTPAPNPEPNWEFFLRVVDDTGKGIAMRPVLK